MKSIVVASLLLLTISAQAQVSATATATPAVTASQGEAKQTVCTSGADSRTFDIKAVENGCELTYIKKDSTKVLATQKNGFSKCQEVAQGVQDKLTAAGFTCQ
jgi:ABC-type oligopeptide transport system substrate-binding subunit